MNDLIRLAMEHAVRDFGDKGDGIFNAAGLSDAICKLAGVRGALDGKVVRAILTGRPDVELLKGGCHYRMLSVLP